MAVAPLADEDFLTPAEVARLLRLRSLTTVYKLIGTGEIPAVRFGNQWRIRRRELEAMMPAVAR